jgi:broad specificity phosphatase PhoE
MGMLYLIRHGQASAHLEDYDQLSELGKQQGSLIGSYFTNKQIDAIYIGPRKRHLQTYEAARQPDWPIPIQTYWLDEFPAHELMNKGLDKIKTIMPDIIGEIAQVQQQTGSAGKSFHKILQRATQLWIDGRLEVEGVESFEEYKHRLLLAQRSLCIEREGDVLCFTSAGFIASFVGFVQKGDEWQALRSAWALYNGSFSTYHLSSEGPLFSSFNWMEHIERNLRTFL